MKKIIMLLFMLVNTVFSSDQIDVFMNSIWDTKKCYVGGKIILCKNVDFGLKEGGFSNKDLVKELLRLSNS